MLPLELIRLLNLVLTTFDGRRIRLRIGINSDPVVTGMVGAHRFAYVLWGDVVNTASRMISEGEAGRSRPGASLVG